MRGAVQEKDKRNNDEGSAHKVPGAVGCIHLGPHSTPKVHTHRCRRRYRGGCSEQRRPQYTRCAVEAASAPCATYSGPTIVLRARSGFGSASFTMAAADLETQFVSRDSRAEPVDACLPFTTSTYYTVLRGHACTATRVHRGHTTFCFCSSHRERVVQPRLWID
ncbi:hypothetical protein MRX96_004746 [Rhipicephalus microplus]